MANVRNPVLPLQEQAGGGRKALRILIGMLLLLVISGGATAAIAYNEVGGIVDAFKQTATVKLAPKVLAPSYKGGPQTLLLVGTDQRKSQEVFPHSNEMLLVRIDPSKPTISMLSIPRELSVSFTTPNGENLTEQRFNSAYFYGWLQTKHSVSGGIKLMLETIKSSLGLSVNQVFIVDFKKFEHAIEEMGCVYFPVDKRYYHNNSEPGAEQYFEINLEPGYQSLCGKEALEYVANRHESSSIVRDARDQRFVLEVKKQYGGSLLEEREKFEHILGKNLQTTLKSSEEILNLLYLLVESTGKPVRQVHFPISSTGLSSTGAAIDDATTQDIHQAATNFLNGTSKVSNSRIDKALEAADTNSRKKHKAPLEASMVPTSEEAIAHARSVSYELPFPLEYPRIRNASSAAEPDELRLYKLHSPNRIGHRSYVIVVSRGLLGQYYDVEGTTWLHPPILDNPSETVTIGRRAYSLYYSGEHVTTVAWREGNAVYWVENTLTNNVSPRQMVEIAEETQPVDATRASAAAKSPLRRAKAAEQALKVPAASTESKTVNARLALVIGAVTLLGLIVLAALALLWRRRLRQLRAEMARAAGHYPQGG